MKTRTLLLASVGLLFAWTGTVHAQVPKPVTDLIAQWQSAFNSGDAAGVAALYTQDAMRAPPEAPLIRGRDAVREGLAENMGWKIKLSAAGALMGPESGTSWGDFELTGTENGQPVTRKGRWMNAMKKTADGWRIYRDIWNAKESDGM